MANGYSEQAEEILVRGGNVEVAQAEATLALAYEQRTANLIAILNTRRISFSRQQAEMIWLEVLDRVGIQVSEKVP
jgi:hypothetical protein